MQTMLWISLTFITFRLSKKFIQQVNIRSINPILITILLLIILLQISRTNYLIYEKSTEMITKLLGPIVVMLAVPIYKNIEYLKKNIFAIFSGICVSMITSIFSLLILNHMFSIEKTIQKSMYPKSITTPMALEITKMINGNEGLTIAFVVFTGIIGATLADFTLKIFNVTNPIAKGIGIGASSHGIGTSKAIEIDESAGAASSLSMAITGVTTVLFFSIFSIFY